jgi:hypothetical protein
MTKPECGINDEAPMTKARRAMPGFRSGRYSLIAIRSAFSFQFSAFPCSTPRAA